MSESSRVLSDMMPQNNTPAIRCCNLTKSYDFGVENIQVFANLSFQLAKGEMVSIMGASGAGKSTLLNLLGGLDQPSHGSVQLSGIDLSTLSESALAKTRNQHLGFVYQFHHLLPEFSAVENVAIPLWLRGISRKKALNTAIEFLEQVGLASRLHHRPANLSGGERQRVAIARAMVGAPTLVLMDEPTGNLDRENAQKVLTLIKKLHQEQGMAAIIVTHDPLVSAIADHQLVLTEKGLVAADTVTEPHLNLQANN